MSDVAPIAEIALFPFIGPAIEAIAVGSGSLILLACASGLIVPALRRLAGRRRSASTVSHVHSAIQIESARS